MISVLYVDDEPDLLDLTRIFLEQTGEFRVDTLQFSQDVIAHLEKNHYDAIVSDYQMPDLDGISLLKEVRANNAEIPFILFTGKGREQIVIEALNNGADFYLQKGGDPRSQFAELMHKIRQAVNKKKAEANLYESEKRLADIINFLPDPMLAIDRNGIVMAWNLAMGEVTGIPAHDMIGKGDYEYAIPFYGYRRPLLIDLIFESDAVISRNYSGITRENDNLIAETDLPRPKGRPMTISGKASPLYNKDGEIVGAIESIRDITSQKVAEDELRAAYEEIRGTEEELREQYEKLSRNDAILHETEDNYRTLMEHSQDIIYIFRGGKFILINQRATDLLGYSKEELREILVYDLIHPDDREKVIETGKIQIRAGAAPKPQTARILTKSGEVRYFEFSAQKIRYQGFHAVFGIARDVTERERNSIQISRHTKTISTISQVILASNQVNTVDELLGTVLETVLALLSYEAGGFYLIDESGLNAKIACTRNLKDTFIHEIANLNIHAPPFEPVFVRGEPVVIEDFASVCPQYAHRIPIKAVASIPLISHDTIIGALNIASFTRSIILPYEREVLTAIGKEIGSAITRLKAEEKLRSSEENFRLLVKTIPEPVYIIVNNRFEYLNEAAAELYGISSPDLLMGTSVFDRIHPKYHESVKKRFSRLLDEQNPSIRGDEIHVRMDGTPVDVEVTSASYRYQGKEGILLILRDITARRLAADELQNAYERLSVAEEELRTQYEELLFSDQNLRESEKRFRTLAEHNTAAIFVFRDKILYANPAGERLLGYSPEEISHVDPHIFVDPSSMENLTRRERERNEGKGSTAPLELRIRRKNGDLRWIGVTTTEFLFEGKNAILCICVDITDRKEMEEEIRSSRQILTNILENFPGVVFWKDQNSVYLGCNKNFSTGAGLSDSSQIIGKTDLDLPWCSTESESYREHDRKVMGTGIPTLNIIESQLQADGRIVWFSTNKIPLYGPDKRITGVLGTSNDITDLKNRELELQSALEQLSATEEELRTQYNDLARGEQQLRESEEKFRAIVEQSLDSNIIVDFSGTILFSNRHITDIVDVDVNSIAAGTISVFDFLTPEYREKAKNDVMNVSAGTDSYLVNYPIITRNGKPLWIEAIGKKITYSGKPAMLLSIRDISGRKLADERIARVNKAFLAFGTDPEKNINILTGLAGELLQASVAIYHKLNEDQLEVVGEWNLPPGFVASDNSEGHICFTVIRNADKPPLVIPDLLDSPYAKTDPNIEKHQLRTFIGKSVRIGDSYTGSLCLAYNKIISPTDQDLELISLIANGIAIEDERRIVEQKLVEGRERYRELFELGNEAIFLIDNRTSRILEANAAASEMYGYSHDELLAMYNTDLSAEPDETRKATVQSRFGSIVIPLRYHKKKDGTVFPVEITGRFFTWNRKNVHVAAIRDITHHKHTEDALRRANKKLNLLNSVTRHDVANQLTVLQGYAQLSMSNNTNPVVTDFLKKIDELSDTISGQIAFTGMYQELGVHAPAWHNLEKILTNVKPADILFSSRCNDVEIFADPMLEKVFANLFDNAIRHGERVTRITINCTLVDDGLLVTVEDNGIGIPLDLKQKIFRKGYGKHTGFGLFLVREILAITGISIHETGKHGTGACFEITVPKGGFRRQQSL